MNRTQLSKENDSWQYIKHSVHSLQMYIDWDCNGIKKATESILEYPLFMHQDATESLLIWVFVLCLFVALRIFMLFLVMSHDTPNIFGQIKWKMIAFFSIVWHFRDKVNKREISRKNFKFFLSSGISFVVMCDCDKNSVMQIIMITIPNLWNYGSKIDSSKHEPVICDFIRVLTSNPRSY